MGSKTLNDSNNTFTATQEWNSGSWWNPFDGYYEWRSWTIVGKGGNDQLTGGAKTDYIYGDYKFGTQTGLSGSDTLKGRGGGDYLYAEEGNDVIYGDYGFGSVNDGGAAGNDVLDGGFGNDLLYGEAGTDTLLGGYGDDYLNGYGNTYGEQDQLTGGYGSDRFVLGDGTGVFYNKSGTIDFGNIRDFTFGADKIQVRGSLSNYTLDKNYNWSGTGARDTAILYYGELVGVVQDNTSIQLNSSYFTAV